jgi:hypothetical protein
MSSNVLKPFEYAILTIKEANLLLSFIERVTATKSTPRNYDKMAKMGILDTYNNLREFVEGSEHYDSVLRGF